MTVTAINGRIDVEAIKAAAVGRWPDILASLGGIPLEILDGKNHPCPKCDGADRFSCVDIDRGALLCRHCFNQRNGDGLAALQWLRDWTFPTACRETAEYLGIATTTRTARRESIIESLARVKKCPVDALRAFGAREDRNRVAFPCYGPDGAECTIFAIWPDAKDKRAKGLFAKGKPAGLFFPHAGDSPRLPVAGETWLVVEGVKDAAALHGLGFNACGLNRNELATQFVRLFIGVHIIIVPDRDLPGIDGAEKSARRLFRHAASVHIAHLPGEVADSHGDDIRDVLQRQNGAATVRDAIASAVEWKSTRVNTAVPTIVINESIDDPHRLARLYLQRNDGNHVVPTIHFYRGEWHKWDGFAYRPVEDVEIRAELGAIAKDEFDAENREAMEAFNAAKLAGAEDADKGPPICRKVTRTLLNNVLQALEGMTLLSGAMEQPAWLGDDRPFPADEVLATRSGLLHLPSLINNGTGPIPPTPLYFSRNALPFAYDPTAECMLWREFLSTLWPDDAESIATLQEWFGYCLLPDTRHHKLLMLVGPPRSGKGTIGRILAGLVGAHNLASPTLASLAGPFGLQPLVGKLVGVIADARLSGRADAVAVVERLLSISGEDPQDVHRKNLSALTGIRLPVRFMILTNELPNMRDVSGALTTRVILLRLLQNFVGREDKTLTSRLLAELPGILNWAIAGWDRLQQDGGFVQPESGQKLLDDLEDLASPVKSFVADCCLIGREHIEFCDDIYEAWKQWCQISGRDHCGTIQTFGRDLLAAFPYIQRTQPRIGETRRRAYQGIRKR